MQSEKCSILEIELCKIQKTYNPGLFKKKVQAVQELSLDVYRGEVFGLVGPNGAGKSTTIRLMLGLMRPDSGAVRFQGNALGSEPYLEKIGYLPENPYLYDHLNLQELLDFCGKTSGLDVSAISRRGLMLMDKLGLLHAKKRALRTFSKGMLQRAGICFALLHDPSVVILDEPMSGLDPIGREMVFDLVQELKLQGKTVFFCSHILNDVERLCDRIGLLVNGRLLRTFDRDDFLQDDRADVYLLVADLSDAQLEELTPLVSCLRPEGDGYLLAVSTAQFFAMNAALERLEIDVLGSRAEWASLENLFMRTVKGVGE